MKTIPANPPTALRRAVDTFLSWLAFVLFVAVLGTAVGAAYVYRSQQLATEAQPTAQPAPAPDVRVTTRQTTAVEPVAPTYPFTLPQGSWGAWEPHSAPVADIGGRRYQDLGGGYVELDDGTRLWVVIEQPAPVVEAPQAAQAAQWVQPVSELAPTSAPEPSAAQAGKGLEKVSDILLRGGK